TVGARHPLSPARPAATSAGALARRARPAYSTCIRATVRGRSTPQEGGTTMQTRAIVGQGQYRYEIDKGWARGAGGVPEFGIVSGLAVDSADRIYIFQRTPTAEMFVFDTEGRLLNRWGRDLFDIPHGIWISPDDHLYLTDTGLHQVLCCTT